MKRSILLSVLALCGYAGLSAQEYEYVPLVREGVEWGYMDAERFRFEGDTLINDKQYYKCNVYHSCDDENPQRSGYFREENRKVYFIADRDRFPIAQENNTQEILLYDFTPTQVGDKIVISRVGAPVSEEFGVTKIDTVLIDGSLRKQFKIDDFYTLIEGLGVIEYSPLDFPFMGYAPCIGCPEPATLMYVKPCENHYEYNPYGNPCEEVAVENVSTPSLHIAQHPGQWIVTLPNEGYRMAEVIDTTGRIAWCEYIDGSMDRVAIPTTDLARGIYIVALTAESGERITCKVIL